MFVSEQSKIAFIISYLTGRADMDSGGVEPEDASL